MTESQKRMAAIFDEWARRYAEKPDDFSAVLGANGKPVTDYGECCALCFHKIEAEMVAAGTIPAMSAKTE